MKRNVMKIVALCLMACLLLTACGGDSTTTYSCAGMTMEIPSNYKEVGGEAAQAYTFALANNKTTVLGLQEAKADFEAYGLNPTLEEYAQLVQQANDKNMTVSHENGLILMEYDSYVNGNTFTYIAAVYENDYSFWLIQFASLKDDYAKYRDTFVEYLMTVNP